MRDDDYWVEHDRASDWTHSHHVSVIRRLWLGRMMRVCFVRINVIPAPLAGTSLSTLKARTRDALSRKRGSTAWLGGEGWKSAVSVMRS